MEVESMNWQVEQTRQRHCGEPDASAGTNHNSEPQQRLARGRTQGQRTGGALPKTPPPPLPHGSGAGPELQQKLEEARRRSESLPGTPCTDPSEQAASARNAIRVLFLSVLCQSTTRPPANAATRAVTTTTAAPAGKGPPGKATTAAMREGAADRWTCSRSLSPVRNPTCWAGCPSAGDGDAACGSGGKSTTPIATLSSSLRGSHRTSRISHADEGRKRWQAAQAAAANAASGANRRAASAPVRPQRGPGPPRCSLVAKRGVRHPPSLPEGAWDTRTTCPSSPRGRFGSQPTRVRDPGRGNMGALLAHSYTAPGAC